jgi:phospholipid transport system substrate-binding protein
MIGALRYAFRPAAFVLMVAMAAGAHAARAAAARPDPVDLVRGIGDAIVALLNGPSADDAKRTEGFRAAYRANFDHAGIVAAVAGPAYRRASPAQRRRLLGAFEDYIVAVYASRLARYYAGEKLIVLGSETDGDVAVVASLLVPRDARAQGIEIKWRLVAVGGSLRIRDVVIDKISVLLSLRRAFAPLLRGPDAGADALIAALRRKTSEAEAERAEPHAPPRPVRAGR